VKGKLISVPVAVIRGLALADDGSTASDLLRGGDRRPVLARHRRGDRTRAPTGATACAVLGAQVRRPAGRAPTSIESAVADALTAPAPHHTRPARFVWITEPRSAVRRCSTWMKDAWRSDLGERRPARRAPLERRIAKGQILVSTHRRS
jgi:coenzyme F420-0:L-glutamate ligase/coenzyme F420-1:gamma-L-glutamate ligase